MNPPVASPNLRFGPFTVDPRAGELRKGGTKLRLQEKSFRVLLALLERQGDVVTREELHERLWPKDTFVDFEDGLHTAVKKLRDALADDAENPRYVETIRGRGYRFLVPVEIATLDSTSPNLLTETTLPLAAPSATNSVILDLPQAPPKTQPRPPRSWKTIWLAAAALLAIALLLLAIAIPRWRLALQPAKTPDRIKLVVLPFQNLTGDADEEYVSDGFTEEIITHLGQLDHDRIAVIARTSSMAYKGSQKSVREIAKELEVEYVLEGSIRKTQEGLRVTAQLIRADDQTHLWAHEYDRSFEGLVQIQQEVAQAVAQEIQVNLAPDSGAALASAREVNPDAYRSYLKGRYFLAARSGEGLAKAVAAFQDSVDHDPNYAPAYAGMADAYNLQMFYGYFHGVQGVAAAKSAAQKAIELDPNLARGHASLAYTLFMWDWKWADAEREFQKAIQLDPNLSTAHHWYAQCLAALGRTDEALAQIRIAEELDPLALIVTTAHGQISYFARQYDAAAEECRVALHRNPDFMVAHAVLGLAEEQQHKEDQAIEEFQKAMDLSGGRPAVYLDYLGHAYAKAEKRQEAEAVLQELEKKGSPAFRAATLLALGRKTEAIDALEESYKLHGDVSIIWMLVDPRLDSLRSDSRYSQLMDKFRTGGPPKIRQD